MKKIFIAAILIILAVIVFFLALPFFTPVGPGNSGEHSAVENCMHLCSIALQNGNDLSAGPCLSNKIVDYWVCDVAHNPRTAVDNEPANQCHEFGKSANHFVEVSPACELIRMQ
jgi:hypothetical protein